MKERQILFSGPMVRAILEGRKTQTRRTRNLDKINTDPDKYFFGGWVTLRDELHAVFGKRGTEDAIPVKSPYGRTGDRLWVRETCCIAPKNFAWPDDTCVKDKEGDPRFISYKATCKSEEAMRDYGLKWTPSIHMPRWASRINLEIVSVRVERLQDISEEDAVVEGTAYFIASGKMKREIMSMKSAYADLWQSINGPGSWDRNPWVWVVEFRRAA